MEEERRLAYVGITRARDVCYMSHAWSRSCSASTQYNPPSRFLDEIPEHLIESTGNVSGRSSYGRQSYGTATGERRWRLVRRSAAVPPRRTGSSVAAATSTPTSAPTRTLTANGWSRRPSASGAQNSPAPSNSQELGLRIGDDVEHPSFGDGVIIDISGEGDKAEAAINFAGVGTKHLALAWAPLKEERERRVGVQESAREGSDLGREFDGQHVDGGRAGGRPAPAGTVDDHRPVEGQATRLPVDPRRRPDPRRHVGAWRVHLRTGAVGGIEHRQPAGDARQEGSGVLYVRARSGQGLDKLTGALGDTGAYVIGGLAMSRSKLGEHTEVFAERLVAATADA